METAPSVVEVATPHSPIYLVADVARYVHLHHSTARSWVHMIPGRGLDLEPGAGLCFLDLVSMLMMRQLRDIGVDPRRIRRAEAYLTEHLGAYPFARSVIWTDGHHVLFAPDSPLREEVPQSFLVSANSGGQQAFVELIHQYLRSISYSEEGIAVKWAPRSRVELDPSKQFGQPRITGTRILTHTIYWLHRAGDSHETITKAYDISYGDVREAIEWEESLLEAA